MRYARVYLAGRLVAYVGLGTKASETGLVRFPFPIRKERGESLTVDFPAEDRVRRRLTAPDLSLPLGPGAEGSYHA